MDEVVTSFFGEAEAHSNSLGGVVNDLDYGWQIVEKPLSGIAMEVLDRGRIASNELEIFGRFGKHRYLSSGGTAFACFNSWSCALWSIGL